MVDPMVRYIKAELGDPDLHSALALMAQSITTHGVRNEASETQIMLYQSAHLQSIEPVLSVFKETSALQVLKSTKAIAAASKLLSTLRSLGPMTRVFLEYYADDYCVLVTVSGLCIP
jgi:hypothetical protein